MGVLGERKEFLWDILSVGSIHVGCLSLIRRTLDENQSQAKSKGAQGTISWPLLAKVARMTEDL